MARGHLITLEGGEGAGKSTQSRRLSMRLAAAGIACIETREPGGSPFADQLRACLLAPTIEPRSALAEALTFYAARADHIAHTIQPALEAGRWVISDRYSDSTRAYQGAAGGVPASVIDALEAMVTADARPRLTVLLDLDPAAGLARARHRAANSGSADAFEARELGFHQRLREGFLAIARAEPARVVVIDAGQPEAVVADAIWHAVVERLDIR